MYSATPCADLARLSHRGRGLTQLLHLIRPDPEALQNMRAEGIDQRDIGGIVPPCHDNSADAGSVVAGVECVPLAIEPDFDPGAEIHRVDDGDADVAEMAVDIAGRDVEAAAEGQRQMGEVAADADTFLIGLKGGAGGAGLQIVKLDMVMDEIADGLHAAPAGDIIAEQVPGNLAQAVGFAVAAAVQKGQAGVGQRGDGDFPRGEICLFGQAAIFDCGIAPNGQVALRGDHAAAAVAEEVEIGGGWNWRIGECGFGHPDISGAVFMD